MPEEELEAVPFAEMTFSFQGSKEPLTVKDFISLTLSRLDKEINTPIPLLKRDEWQKERTAKAKEIITTLQSQLLSVSKLQKRKMAHSTASIFSRDVEQIIGQGIIAQCQLNNLNPHVESDRQKAANSIADMADSLVGRIGKFQWEVAVARIGQLASGMRLSTGGQSIGGSNGNADELTNWDGTKKNGLGW